MTLPTGRPGRGIVMTIKPWVAPGATDQAIATHASEPFTLVLARESVDLERALYVLLSTLLMGGAALALGITLAVLVLVRRSLQPLDAVGYRAGQIDAYSLDKRLPLEGLADELRPICHCINELLGRVEAGFKRERQFTANVAHELRTPIAELRTLSEVALTRALRSGLKLDSGYRDALDIAVQMESTVTALLAVARCNAGTQTMTPTPVDLGDFASVAWRRFAPKAEAKGLRTDIQFPVGASIVTDCPMLLAVLDNLFSNAIDYAPAGGEVCCRLERSSSRAALTISNTVAGLESADVERMFEPFWRKDAVRTSSSALHVGLGLSLVEAYAKLLGIGVKLNLATPSLFVASLTFAVAATNQPYLVPSATPPLAGPRRGHAIGIK